MKNESTDEAVFDAALTHGLARVALGLNIAMHGYTRLPNLAGFANEMVKQFAATFLSGPLVYVAGFGIAVGEAASGHSCFLGCFLGQLL
jgi:thiosulfate dehydrogenase [quinone] large subunit